MTRHPVDLRRLALVLALAAAPALASEIFPPAIQVHLSLSYQPPCSYCHQNGITGFGTVTTPFGMAMTSHGAFATNEASVLAALDALQAAGIDSDGDGVSDIDELKAGTDPNGGTSASPLRYGCGASVAPGLLGALGALALVRRRRR